MPKKKQSFEGFSTKKAFFGRQNKRNGKAIITEKQIVDATAIFLKEGGKIATIKGRFNPELPMYAMDLDPREYGHN